MRSHVPRSRSGAVLVAAVTAMLPTHALAAQRPGGAANIPNVSLERRPCSMSESSMTRVAVYAYAQVPDSFPRSLVPSAENFLQSVADTVHDMLPAAPGVLPAGEPAVMWPGASDSIALIAHRNGKLEVVPPAKPKPASAADLLSRAVQATVAAGETVFWPDNVKVDSFPFAINTTRPMVDSSGKLSELPVRHTAIPIFSIRTPWEEPAKELSRPRVYYPAVNQYDGVSGTAVLSFVVDAAGRVDPSTIKDVWPATQPQLTGSRRAYYLGFVDAAKKGVLGARFSPALIGGCPVRMLVQEPFVFGFR